MKVDKQGFEYREVARFTTDHSTGVVYRPILPQEEYDRRVKAMEEAAIALIREYRYNKLMANKDGE